MGFTLTEEQQMLKDAALDFGKTKLAVSEFRKLRDNAANGRMDATTYQEMVDMGWTGVLVPESYGGSDFGYQGLGVILEAQGRTLASTPLLQTALIGVSALLAGASEAQKSDLLPKIVVGEVTTALAIDEGPHHNPKNISMAATSAGDGFVLSGEKRFVPDGANASHLIVVTRSSAQQNGTAGLTLFIVPSDSPGLIATALDTLDKHAAANLTFDNVRLGADAVLGEVGQGVALLEDILDKAAIGYAAELFGLSAAAFEITHEYLQTRKQFGQLIGSFQSLQHRAAQMFSELELTQSCVAAALSALDDKANNISELASLAKARANETAHLVTNEMIQMHGGIGMTDEHDAGLYIKRSRTLEALYGSDSYHRNRYAEILGY